MRMSFFQVYKETSHHLAAVIRVRSHAVVVSSESRKATVAVVRASGDL